MRSPAILVMLSVLQLMALASAAAAEPETSSPSQVQYTWDKEIFVEMRDGVRLSTDVLLPTGRSGPFPTVLVRTPYHKDNLHWVYFQRLDELFLDHGYAVVIQNERGRHLSEGSYDRYLAGARTDGYDTVSWIVSQPWSNGRVGTFGCSSSGEHQWPMASANHPNHAAMLPLASGTAVGNVPGNHTQGSIYRGGVRMNGLWIWWYSDLANSERLVLPPGTTQEQRVRLRDNFNTQVEPYFYNTMAIEEGLVPLNKMESALSHLPARDILRHLGRPLSPFDEVLTKGPADPYWDSVPLIGLDDRPRVPALHVNTWHDVGVAETIRLFDHLEELATPNQHLIIGAGPHCSMLDDARMADLKFGDLELGDARYGENGGGYERLFLGWFDRWLKGDTDAMSDLPRVQLYVMNRGWMSGDRWPLDGTAFERYFLHSDGNAGCRMDSGLLATEQPAVDSPADAFVYDPGNPTPSRGGGCCGEDVALDQRPVEARSDVLVYSTPPLAEGLTVVGPIKVVLWVSSSARDTDFMVKIVDVHPDGSAINLYDDALRVRYREGFHREVFMEPDRVYPIILDNFVTANYFAPGHRVRIEVSSSNFPVYVRNLNTGGSNHDETTWTTAENRVHHSAAHPSHVLLPVLAN
jgi:putative CocE/NonD family hydrolase